MNIEEIIKNHVTSGKSPGISVGIINESGIQTFNYGEIKKKSNIEPTTDTVFEIGSITKPFVTILAAQLQQEGLLSLDDPITKFLPQIKFNSDIARKKITLHHLITHTADLPNTLPLRTIIPYLIKLSIRKKHPYNPFSNYSKEEFYEYLGKRKIKRVPGTVWSYSNYGYALLGHVLEQVTNSSFEELVKNRICKPLGMKDTGINLLNSHKGKMATGYTSLGVESNFWSSPSMEGMISLRSTVNDLLKFTGANLGLSKSNLSPILEYCLSTKINPSITPFMKYYPKYVYGLPVTTFRLGWFVFDLGNNDFIGHDGGTEGFSSFLIMNPENKSGVVILTNKLNPRHVHKLGMSLIKEMNKKIDEGVLNEQDMWRKIT